METLPTVSLLDQVCHIIRDAAEAVSFRTGESASEQQFRLLVATHSVLAFKPRDTIEARFASSCVVFHELIVHTARTTLCGEAEPKRRGPSYNVVALDRRFGNNLGLLKQYQMRQAADAPDSQTVPAEPATAKPAEIHTETQIADRIRRHRSQTPTTSGRPAVRSFTSPEAYAECLANPEAMAALDAGDPERFAKALGIKEPLDGYVEAAGRQMAELNRQAARHPNGTGESSQTGGQTSGQPVTGQQQ
jgi:hypothetical protein